MPARGYRKLNETPFPFPWAQAVNIVILIFAFTMPFIAVAFTVRRGDHHLYVGPNARHAQRGRA
jgi:hypothetical protein